MNIGKNIILFLGSLISRFKIKKKRDTHLSISFLILYKMISYLSAGAVAGAGTGIVTELLVPGAVCGAGASCFTGAV